MASLDASGDGLGSLEDENKHEGEVPPASDEPDSYQEVFADRDSGDEDFGGECEWENGHGGDDSVPSNIGGRYSDSDEAVSNGESNSD